MYVYVIICIGQPKCLYVVCCVLSAKATTDLPDFEAMAAVQTKLYVDLRGRRSQPARVRPKLRSIRKHPPNHLRVLILIFISILIHL